MDTKMTENIKKKLGKVAGYLIWILIIILSFSVLRNIDNSGRIKAQIDAEKARLTKMQNDNNALAVQIAQTQGGAFIEKEIRDKLGLIKSGEVEVVLPDDDTLIKLAPPEMVDAGTLPDPTWRKWEKLFF